MHELHRFFTAYDHKIAQLVAKLPHWLEPIMRAATFIGEPAVVVAVAVTVSVTAWLRGHHRITYAYLAGLVGFGGNTILKSVFHRARPQTLYAHSMKIKSYSFPSGHAYGGLVFYGLLAYLAYKYLPQPWNIVLMILLVLLVFTIGLSRIYLGAHFPSDVTAGWVLGAITLALIIIFIKP